jgi:hypothetical protein
VNDTESGEAIYRTTECPPDFCPVPHYRHGTHRQRRIHFASIRDGIRQIWLCAECESGSIAWGSSCDTCTGVNAGTSILVSLFCFLLIGFFLRSGTSSAGHLSILLFYVQTAAILLSDLGSDSLWMDWLQFVNLSASSIKSSLAPLTPLQQLILVFLTPIILMVVMSFIATPCAHVILRRLYMYDHRQPPSDGASCLHRTLSFFATPFSMHRYIGCAMSILLFCYTAIAVAVVQSLHCVDVGPGVRRLFSAPTVNCNSRAYHQFLPLAFIWLAVYVIGLPLANLIFLRLHRSRLHTSALPFSPSSAAVLAASLNDFDARWGSFSLQYTNRAWFWQPLVLLRRFFFALTSMLLVHDDRTRLAPFTFLNFISLLVHQWTRPFEDEKLNCAECELHAARVHARPPLLGDFALFDCRASRAVPPHCSIRCVDGRVDGAKSMDATTTSALHTQATKSRAHHTDHRGAQEGMTNDGVNGGGQLYELNEFVDPLHPTAPTLHRPLLSRDLPRQ